MVPWNHSCSPRYSFWGFNSVTTSRVYHSFGRQAGNANWWLKLINDSSVPTTLLALSFHWFSLCVLTALVELVATKVQSALAFDTLETPRLINLRVTGQVSVQPRKHARRRDAPTTWSKLDYFFLRAFDPRSRDTPLTYTFRKFTKEWHMERRWVPFKLLNGIFLNKPSIYAFN